MTKASDLSHAFGFLKQAEVSLLTRLAESLPIGAVFINVGAGVGTSALTIAEARPDVKIYTVDISEGGPEGGLENERNAFSHAGLSESLPTQVLGDSQAVGRDWQFESADLLMIDADHAYASCRGDLEVWTPHLKAGGVLLIHDYEPKIWPDVFKATGDFIRSQPESWEFIEVQHTLIAYRSKS